MNKRKSISPVILFFLVVGGAGVGYWAYTHFDLELPFLPIEEVKPVTLPVAVSMTNREGKTIDAVIVGRSATEVSLTKADDPQRKIYRVAISNLSRKDQRFLKGVPIADNPPPKLGSPVIAARKAKLKQLETKLAQLQVEIKSGANSSLRSLSWKESKAQEVDSVELQINQIKADIQLLQKQQPK